MTFREWQKSMTIFAKYHKDGLDGRCESAAEHDQFYCGPGPEPSDDTDKDAIEWPDEDTQVDATALRELGWFWDAECTCWSKWT